MDFIPDVVTVIVAKSKISQLICNLILVESVIRPLHLIRVPQDVEFSSLIVAVTGISFKQENNTFILSIRQDINII